MSSGSVKYFQIQLLINTKFVHPQIARYILVVQEGEGDGHGDANGDGDGDADADADADANDDGDRGFLSIKFVCFIFKKKKNNL